MAATHEITLTNVGPIEGQFRIDLSDGPGLYELSGSKGVGKTTILNALSLISGHKVALTIHDGAKSGKVSGFGVVAPIGSGKRKKGSLGVDTIDSDRFDLADLIDPPGKTPATRDANRIKALATLTGLELTAEDFHEICGGEDGFLRLGVSITDDPVLMATRVKTALESEARRLETMRDTEHGHAQELGRQVRDVADRINNESDATILASRTEDAAAKLATLKQQWQAAEVQRKARADARAKISEAEEHYQGDTSLEVEKQIADAGKQYSEAMKDLKDLEERCRAQREQVSSLEDAYDSLASLLRVARQYEETVAAWKKTIEGKDLPQPTTDELLAAEENLKTSRTAQEDGVRIRDAKQAAELAKRHLLAASEAEEKATDLRNNAQQVFGVLSQALDTQHIKIGQEDGAARLVVAYPKRQGMTYYDAVDGLSDGERVRVAIDELLPHFTSPGLLAIPQRTYQDLPPQDRLDLAEYAKEHGLYLVGAQVNDGPLEVRYLNKE